jgi:hypothetical protein
MRRLLFIGAGVLVFTLSACAQYGRPDSRRDDRRDSRRDDRQGRIEVIDRALEHVQNSRSYDRVDGHERDHFDRARRDLLRFRERWLEGHYDQDRLDGAIENIRDLAKSRQVHPMEQRILSRDLSDLREFRSRARRWRP